MEVLREAWLESHSGLNFVRCQCHQEKSVTCPFVKLFVDMNSVICFKGLLKHVHIPFLLCKQKASICILYILRIGTKDPVISSANPGCAPGRKACQNNCTFCNIPTIL